MNLPSATFHSFRDSLPQSPDRLEKRGYLRTEEATADSSRWVWFTKRRRTFDGKHELEVAIRYELSVGDALGATYAENCDYSLNDVEVSFSRIESAERANELVRVPACPHSLRELENLVSMFCP
jgi:hypothetical protein